MRHGKAAGLRYLDYGLHPPFDPQFDQSFYITTVRPED